MTIQSHHYGADDDQPLAQVIPLFRPTPGVEELAYDEDDQGLILRFHEDFGNGQGAS